METHLKVYRITNVEIAMITLALIDAVLLIVELTNTLTQSQIETLRYIDLFIAITFLAEFFMNVSRARYKLSFIKRHWLELVASVPISATGTQALRLLRLVQLFRFLHEGGRIQIVRDERK